MKNLIRLSIVAGFVLLQSCTPPANSTSATSSKPATNSQPKTKSIAGSDKYEIHWTGSKGNQLYGSYSILTKDFSEPMRSESIQAQVPHKVNFSVSKSSIVSANGDTIGQGKVEVKIYKNGSECGKVMIVGSGVGANKTCE